jgi:hypothetical protein
LVFLDLDGHRSGAKWAPPLGGVGAMQGFRTFRRASDLLRPSQ